MRIARTLAIGITTAAIAGSVVFADSHNTPEGMAVTARKAHMQLYQFNVGTLFSMAKGAVEFDAAAAQGAADNLAALSSLSQGAYWLPNTSSDDLENSRALPAIWQEGSTAGAIGGEMKAAAMALAANAGTLDDVRANIGEVGKACTACHKAYRKPE